MRKDCAFPSLHGQPKEPHQVIPQRAVAPWQNVYYCCPQETASVWLRGVLADPTVQAFVGLRLVPYGLFGHAQAASLPPFQARTIAAHLYIDYPTYDMIRKPDRYRTFYVTRDPRDLVVAWYFSGRFLPQMPGPMSTIGAELEALTETDGLCLLVDRMETWGVFESLRSWATAPSAATIKVFQYEHLATDPFCALQAIFDFLDVPLDEELLEWLVKRHPLADDGVGRAPRGSDPESYCAVGSHLRHFDERVHEHFQQVTGDLTRVSGYAESG